MGDLEATYDDHLRLIGKRVVDFLLVLIELFSLEVTAEGATGEYRLKIGGLLQRGPVDPKFQVQGVAPTNHFSSQKTRLNDLLYGQARSQVGVGGGPCPPPVKPCLPPERKEIARGDFAVAMPPSRSIEWTF